MLSFFLNSTSWFHVQPLQFILLCLPMAVLMTAFQSVLLEGCFSHFHWVVPASQHFLQLPPTSQHCWVLRCCGCKPGLGRLLSDLLKGMVCLHFIFSWWMYRLLFDATFSHLHLHFWRIFSSPLTIPLVPVSSVHINPSSTFGVFFFFCIAL